jgi:kilA-N domain protein|nr:MAG TPA: KilA-N domain [Caudoviricetes sp.]
MKRFILNVLDKAINVKRNEIGDYICLTDMVRGLDNGPSLVEKWLRNKNTIEFLGLWEVLNNPDFDKQAFNEIFNVSGLNRFAISAKQWVEKTKAIGLIAQAGRYGGTYAHKDIAFEFGSWINPTFKLYLIKEYQNLNTLLADKRIKEWDVRRILSKANYSLQTDAIKKHVLPRFSIRKLREDWVYASEADVLNLIVFGCTAKQWEKNNPELKKQGLNMRDAATINQLAVLSNMESLNSELIKQGLTDLQQRKPILHKAAKDQLAKFNEMNIENRFSKLEHLGNPKLLK